MDMTKIVQSQNQDVRLVGLSLVKVSTELKKLSYLAETGLAWLALSIKCILNQGMNNIISSNDKTVHI